MNKKISAPAKINWALTIKGRREDGYHLLDMLMQTITLKDELTFEPADGLALFVNGRRLPEGEKNLVLSAARVLNEYVGTRFGANIALTKRIPARAGLGGGSADCAATLAALNELWDLRLDGATLNGIGLSLGADVPFCLTGGLARVRGVGERVEPRRPGEDMHLVIIHPGGGLSTRDVFVRYDATPRKSVAVDMEALYNALIRRDFSAMKRHSQNALLEAATELMPEIKDAIFRLYACGARFAQMSGSGSAVYGVFEDEEAARAACEMLGECAMLAHT